MPNLRLKSFPVIAVAALLLAALLGFALGSMGGGATVLPATPGEAAVDRDDTGVGPGLLGIEPNNRRGPSENGRRGDGRDGSSGRTGDGSRVGTDGTGPNNPAGGDDRRNDPATRPGERRKLKEGRTDPVVDGPQPERATSAIRVTVTDSRGRHIRFAQLALDVQSGPLGWHAVPGQAQRVAGESGVFVFEGLHPGEFRIRSLNSSYQDIEEIVRITGHGETQSVAVTLEDRETASVEFYLELERGGVPEEVDTRIMVGEVEKTATRGRFGDYKADADPDTHPRGGAVSPKRYRQRPDNGMVKLILRTGQDTTVTFTARTESGIYRGTTEIEPQPGLRREDVTLMEVELADDDPYMRDNTPVTKLALTLTLTVDGKEAEFDRVNLRKDIHDFKYESATVSDENVYTWDSIYSGEWFLVAESSKYHAPFVKKLDLETDEQQTIDIKTGHLRVIAQREPGSPDPSGEMRYRVRLRPMGSGTVERAYNGDMTGKDQDHIDFFVPVGEHAVRVESPEDYAPLRAMPVEQSFTMTDGGEEIVDFTLTAAATLKFTAVNKLGQPIPNVEYLITFHPAGELPETEQENVRKGDYNGLCESAGAPSGPVYVHIWSESTDWQNPDHVFQLDLPAYGIEDLGPVVVGD